MGAPQELIAGRYRLTRRIAAGGMGVVWEARDELLQRPVAVKQLRALGGLPEEEAAFAKERAMREARITARLHHPNAVVVFDSVEHDGEPCLVMQYVPSEPLSAVLRRRGALPVGEVARVGAQIAAALAAAHDLGIVHRDVKPGNILIADADGAALLSDFGISHALGDATLTSTGLMHGTPAYLSPEVARGEESTFAADVFSMGSTLYAASEGEAPFGEAPNSIAVLHRVAVGGFAAPQRSGPLGPLLLQMMADDPAARPSMAEVARQLAALQADEDGTAAPTLPLVTAAETDTALIDTGHRTAQFEPVAVAVDDGDDEEPAATLVVPAAVAPPVPADAAPADTPDVPPPPPADPEPAAADAPRRSRRALIGALLVVGILVLSGLGLSRLLQPATAAPRPAASGSPTSAAPASPAPTSTAPTTAAPTPSSSPTPSRTATPAPSRPSPRPTVPTAPAPTTRPTAAPPSGTGTAAARVAAITRYYGLVPGDLGDAWPLLTSGYQSGHAGGRSAYDRFWAPIGSVSASDVRSTGGDTVRAVITYRYRNGKVATEDTSFTLVPDGGVLKIASSSVISSSG